MKNRLPPFRDVIPVYSVAATFVFGWTLVALFYTLPSYLLFATAGDIIGISAYIVCSACLESILVTLVLVAAAALLPRRVLLQDFVARGTWLISLAYISMILFHVLNARYRSLVQPQIGLWTAATAFLMLATVILSGRVKLLGALAEGFADRVQVFLLLAVPLSAASAVILFVRNVF